MQSILPRRDALDYLCSSAGVFARERRSRTAALKRRRSSPTLARYSHRIGIERLEKIRIGGIDQWVSIRGVDRRNPVLVVIHGGPRDVDMPTSWWLGRGWEECFTVVYWDQRAAGKTYLLTDSATIKPTLTVDRMVADSEELVT